MPPVRHESAAERARPRLRPAAALRDALRAGYGGGDLRADLLAGVVVGVVALPLSMALAITSGVAPQHGLYTAVIAGAAIPLLGGSRFQVSGPTAGGVASRTGGSCAGLYPRGVRGSFGGEMATSSAASDPEPLPSVLTVANVVYALHAFAIAVGLAGSATVIGSFVGSVPSIVAVILNYAKRGGARGTWVESHYRWQIRTFWFAILWVLVAAVLFATVIGIPIGVAILVAVTLWLAYRIARGWLRLRDRRPMYV